MTVKELIERLERQEPSARVFVDTPDAEWLCEAMFVREDHGKDVVIFGTDGK